MPAYYIINTANNLALDLHGNNGRTVLTYSFHGAVNQQWEISSLLDLGILGYTIKNVKTGAYLTPDPLPAAAGTGLICSPTPFNWTLKSGTLLLGDIFSITNKGLAATSRGNNTQVILTPDADQGSKGNQVWQRKPVNGA